MTSQIEMKIDRAIDQNLLVLDKDADCGVLTNKLFELTTGVQYSKFSYPITISKVYVSDLTHLNNVSKYIADNSIDVEQSDQLLDYFYSHDKVSLHVNDMYLVLIEFKDGNVLVGSF